MFKPVKIERLGLDITTDQVVVILREIDGSRSLPIWIGNLEASAIAVAMEGVEPPRPITHDLLKSILDTMGAAVDRIEINDLRNETFYALIHLRVDGRRYEIDSRPSDALALALRTKSPILVADSVLQRAGVEANDEEQKGDQIG
ncbi:MAG TPA: bifunctional nuclease family protein [Firmicutes bacterium]|nr:bifunctional nuclease family protein [Bacillota bacterium]